LYKNDTTQEYQYASQIFYLVIAILAIGLFASFSPPQGFKLLSVTTIYWPIQLALIASSSIAFSVAPFFSARLLILANTALVGVYLMQALQARSWSKTISRRLLWISLLSILIFIFIFVYLLEAFPSSIHYRVRLVGVFLMAYIIWSAIETRRVKDPQQSLQLRLLFWLSIAGIAVILSRLGFNMFAIYLNPNQELVTIYQEDAALVITRFLLGIQMMAIALTSNNYYLEKLWLGGAIAEKQKRSTDNKNIALLQVLAEKNQLLKKLAVTQKASDMGTMVSSLAHELNQPLGAIRLNAEVLLDLIKNAPNSEESQEILEDILKDNIRAADIITRLKRLFQKGSEQFESINLGAIVNDAYLLVKSKCSANEIEVALDIPANALVYGDVGQLQMVVLNLFNNAIEELVSKQGERLIFASIQCEEEKIIFEITDNGSGISSEAANHIFELFHTSKPSGMGVGLWLSRAIMETHNGAITLENNPTGGTCFRLTFYHSELKPTLN
jgi:signal transduction histidine kinase